MASTDDIRDLAIELLTEMYERSPMDIKWIPLEEIELLVGLDTLTLHRAFAFLRREALAIVAPPNREIRFTEGGMLSFKLTVDSVGTQDSARFRAAFLGELSTDRRRRAEEQLNRHGEPPRGRFEGEARRSESDDKEGKIPQPAGGERYVFAKGGDYWTLVFEGESLPQVGHLVGMFYIAYLLARPGTGHTPLELMRRFGDVPTAGNALPEDYGVTLTKREGLETYDPAIDRKTQRECQKTVAELEKQIKAAQSAGNDDGARELSNQVVEIEEYLSKSLGRDGTPRMFMPSQARARSAVLKAIQRAELKFSETAPAFTKHLTENLRFHRGRWAYKPHETIRWVVPEKLR